MLSHFLGTFHWSANMMFSSKSQKNMVTEPQERVSNNEHLTRSFSKRKRWENLIKQNIPTPPNIGPYCFLEEEEKNYDSYKTQCGAECEGYNEESYCWDTDGFLFSLSRGQRQQSFECHRTAFQWTQKSRRFHLFLKLDAIISVNHVLANLSNLHDNTLSCHAP